MKKKTFSCEESESLYERVHPLNIDSFSLFNITNCNRSNEKLVWRLGWDKQKYDTLSCRFVGLH